MKKSLFAFAVAALAFSASAQTVVLENTFHEYTRTKDGSLYQAFGVAQPTKYGTFDAYWQGVRGWSAGVTDRLNGFEVGYGQNFTVAETITLNPRVAYGHMGNINFGDRNGTAKYMLYSLEISTDLFNKIRGYSSISHMNGVNTDAISATNRVQVGVDVAVTEAIGVRVGMSTIRQLKTTQNGVVSMLMYSF